MDTFDNREIALKNGMTFEASVAGSSSNPLVLMLHGFGVSRYSYSKPVSALGDAGFFAVAPNQRGYSPGARPDTQNFPNYRMDVVIADALDIVSALGHGERQFHLVGHDWGASLAWEIADRYPERLASVTILSRPHPLSFERALSIDPEQKGRSKHHSKFLDPNAVAEILANDAEWLRGRLTRNGVPAKAIDLHLSVIGYPEAMEAALAWYRARGVKHAPVGHTKVPTLYIWGDNDDTVGRVSAEGTGEFIDAPYRFEILPGVGHFAADQSPDKVTSLILEHVKLHSSRR